MSPTLSEWSALRIGKITDTLTIPDQPGLSCFDRSRAMWCVRTTCEVPRGEAELVLGSAAANYCPNHAADLPPGWQQ
jgi:hypothetical protein